MSDDRTGRAAYLAVCIVTIVFALAFVFPGIAEQALPWYYPLERVWVWEAQPSGLAMDFFGRGILALGVAVPAGIVAHVIGRRVWAPGDRAVDLLTAWAVTATLLVMLHFCWHLYFRHPTPEPLPDWYVPR